MSAPSAFSFGNIVENGERLVEPSRGKGSPCVLCGDHQSHFAVSRSHVVSQPRKLQEKDEIQLLGSRAVYDSNRGIP